MKKYISHYQNSSNIQTAKPNALFYVIKFSQPTPWYFFSRFMMVVRKNVLEYIITLVVVKNKVQLKKCLKKIQI